MGELEVANSTGLITSVASRIASRWGQPDGSATAVRFDRIFLA